jgi:hypothetical protein
LTASLVAFLENAMNRIDKNTALEMLARASASKAHIDESGRRPQLVGGSCAGYAIKVSHQGGKNAKFVDVPAELASKGDGALAAHIRAHWADSTVEVFGAGMIGEDRTSTTMHAHIEDLMAANKRSGQWTEGDDRDLIDAMAAHEIASAEYEAEIELTAAIASLAAIESQLVLAQRVATATLLKNEALAKIEAAKASVSPIEATTIPAPKKSKV